MRITGLTSRILEYDLREAYGDGPIPKEIFDTTLPHLRSTRSTPTRASTATRCSTAVSGEGRAIGHALHEAYARRPHRP